MDFQNFVDGFYTSTCVVSIEKKLLTLWEKASDPDNVCFSFGYCYNDSGMDIRDAMRIADEEMYKDKEKYYFEHPERKYR